MDFNPLTIFREVKKQKEKSITFAPSKAVFDICAMRQSEVKVLFSHLEEGKHEFRLSVPKELFERFLNDPVLEEIKCLVLRIIIDKQEGASRIVFYLTGQLVFHCSRCLDLLEWDLDYTGEFWGKEGQATEWLNDELLQVGRDSGEIDFAELVGEAMLLGMPMNCTHPEDEEGNLTCNPEMLKYLTPQRKVAESEVWSELKVLLNN